MKRVLICTTILTTVKAFLIPHIRMLQDMGYSVDVAGSKDVTELDEIVDNVYDIPFQRSPFSKQNIVASRKLKELVRKNSYDIIHFHTPISSAFGRWTVKEFRKTGTMILYTAHGFHFFKGAPLKNWLFYYPVERWLARFTDVLITINKEDYKRAHRFKVKRIEYVPGVGLDSKKFVAMTVNRDKKRADIGITVDAFVVLSVGELNKNKNHETVIKAIAKLNNPNIYYIICGVGNNEGYLKELSEALGISDKVKLLGYRTDVIEMYKVADIFAFPSFREGLSVALMEAMASGLAVVCSNIRGNKDLIENEKCGYLVKPKDVEGLTSAINKLLVNKEKRYEMGKYNEKVVTAFDINDIKIAMGKIYSEVLLKK